uniref:Uncharacterized protein n=1 Tax=Cacopsylla melanoneura TaxID=428564 RepID=A0A8D8MEY4_9HEMI
MFTFILCFVYVYSMFFCLKYFSCMFSRYVFLCIYVNIVLDRKKKLKKGVLMKCCCNGSGTKEISKGNKLRGGVFYWVKIPFRDSESIPYVPVWNANFSLPKKKEKIQAPPRQASPEILGFPLDKMKCFWTVKPPLEIWVLPDLRCAAGV